MDCFATPALSLPRLTGIPATPTIEHGREARLEMARALIYAGLLTPECLTGKDLGEAIHNAIGDWLHPQEPPAYFSDLSYSYTNDEQGDPGFTDRHHHFLNSRAGGFRIATQRDRYVLIIGPTILKLEAHTKGLGRNLLILIEQAASAACGVFTPASAMSCAEGHYWRGEGSPKEVLEEYADGMDDSEKADFLAKSHEDQCADLNIPTVAYMHDGIPEIARKLPRSCWNPGPVPTFPVLRGPLAAGMRAASALADHLRMVRRRWLRPGTPALRYHDGTDPNDRRNMEYMSELAAPVIIRWDDNDPVTRVFDDEMNEAFQNGDETDLYTTAVIRFDPTDPDDCRDARLRMEALMTTTRLLDTLLNLTTELEE